MFSVGNFPPGKPNLPLQPAKLKQKMFWFGVVEAFVTPESRLGTRCCSPGTRVTLGPAALGGCGHLWKTLSFPGLLQPLN